MATFKDLQDRINLDYLNNMTLIAETKRAIRNAIKTYEAQRYWFNETLTAIAASTVSSGIAVPTDFLTLDRLEVTVNSNDYALIQREFFDIRDMNVSRTRGQPTHFAYHGDKFELAIHPDSAYSINLHYIRSLAELSADSDSNAWTNEAANLICHAACVDLLSGVLQVPNSAAINRHVAMLAMAQNELNLRNGTRLNFRLKSTYF
jgi:hypothetical protein